MVTFVLSAACVQAALTACECLRTVVCQIDRSGRGWQGAECLELCFLEMMLACRSEGMDGGWQRLFLPKQCKGVH